MQAIILAGGKGTRMGNLTQSIPKPMIEINNKPILEYQIELLKKYNISDIYILVNYLKDSIVNYFGNGEKFGVNISYHEEITPLGTVGGIKEIENKITGPFLVLYGDVMVNINIEKLIEFHNYKKSKCTLVIHPNDHPIDSDLVDIDNNDRVTAFYSKPHNPDNYYKNLVNAALYLFDQIVIDHLIKGQKADFGKDIFPNIIDKIPVYGYNTAEYLKDMGTPKRLEQVTKDLNSGKIRKSNYEFKRKAIFLDRDGVINIETSFIHKTEDFKLYDYTAEAIKKINRSEYIAIVVTNQSVIARNLCTFEELDEIHKKMETELGKEGAKLDKIYYCPHHPDSGYPEEREEYKIKCSCRKPNTGMIEQAIIDFNIDIKNSFIIGDSGRDIECGHSAGCTTIGVRTGHGVKDAKIEPDYILDNINEAVNLIMSLP